MKKYGKLWMGIALPFALFADPVIYLDDNFNDGDRTNQSLPGSAQWWGGSSAETSVVEVSPGSGNYALKIAPTGVTIRHGVAYFAPSDAPVSLASGESIKVSFDLTPLTTPSAGDNNFRFGLLNSGSARLTSDANPNLIVEGYGVFVNPDGSRIHMREKTNTSGPLFSSLTYWSSSKGIHLPEEENIVAMTAGNTYAIELTVTRLGNDSLQFDFAMTAGSTYAIDLTVTRLGNDSLQFDFAMTDGTDSVFASFTPGNLANVTYDFDSFGIGWITESGAGLIDNVKVSVIPEPGSVGLLGFGALVAAGIARRVKR